MPFNQGRKAIVKLVNRRVFSVQGQDAFKFIQAILTNDMKYLTQPKQAIYGAFLNSKGRLIGDCHVIQLQVS
jgi:folate-binding Fe-S cluster repair protein YgfZ